MLIWLAGCGLDFFFSVCFLFVWLVLVLFCFILVLVFRGVFPAKNYRYCNITAILTSASGSASQHSHTHSRNNSSTKFGKRMCLLAEERGGLFSLL